MGQRIAKHVYDENFQLQKSTYYILDASGNVMATYDKEINYAESKTYFKLKERHIYGSSRVGVRNSDLDVLPLPDKDFSMTTVHYSIGSRTYELSNHLGNVLSVISDTAEGSHEVNVIPVFPYSNVISEMRADIRVAQDYSPFGVTLDGRNFVVSEGYRYGFNGKESDNEMKGDGNSYDFGARMYDPRLGRWLSMDPHQSTYPSLTPYNFVSNMPIIAIDPDGKDIIILIQNPTSGHRYGHQAVLIEDTDKGGWWYYSLDGDTGPSTGTVKYFKTLEEFQNSEHNTFKNDYDDNKKTETSELDSDGDIKQRYSSGYRIETSKTQDRKMRSAAKRTVKKGYSTFTNNCTDVPRVALDAGGLNNGEYTEVPQYCKECTKTTTKSKNVFPKAKQAEIEKSNKGKRISINRKKKTE